MDTSQWGGGPGSGYPHQARVDDADVVGVKDLREFVGDAHFVLSTFASMPEGMFDLDPDVGTADELVQLLGLSQQTIAALEALGARAVVALSEQKRAEERAAARDACAHEPQALATAEKTALRRADRSTQRCVSMRTRCSPDVAGRRLSRARRLVASMPGMLSALAEGKVTGEVAYSTAGAVGPLAPEQREWVDQQLTQRLPDLDGAGAGQFRREVQALIHAQDPAGAAARHENARRDRSVSMTPGEHGMATLTAHLSAMDATLIRKRLSLEAERLIVGGDRRGHTAIMADLLTDSVLGTAAEGAEPVTLDVGVIITERALLCPHSEDVAHLEGYGPVPAHVIRQQLRQTFLGTNAHGTDDSDPDTDPDPAADGPDGPDAPHGRDGPAFRAVLRRLFTHPTTGQLLNLESRARAFPPVLAQFIRLRDIHCRGPFCDAKIRQIDHITPYSEGGETCADGGQGGCQFCNDKENQTTSVRRVGTENDGEHTVEWTDHHGTTRTTNPTPLIRPIREPNKNLRSSSDEHSSEDSA